MLLENVSSRFIKNLAIQNIFTCFYMVYSNDCLVIIMAFCSCLKLIYQRLLFDFISFLQLYDIIMTADNKSFITMFYIIAIVLLFIIRCRFPKSRSLTGVIRSRYDNHVLKIIRKYEKYDYKICKLSVDIEFLNNCLNHDLCPPFLKYKMSSKRLQTSDKYKISQRVFTQQETTFQTLMIEKVCEQLNKVKDDLRTVVSFFDCSHIANTLAESNIKE